MNHPLLYYSLLLFFCLSHTILANLGLKELWDKHFASNHYRLFYNLFSLAILTALVVIFPREEYQAFFEFPGQSMLGYALIIMGSTLGYLAFKSYDTAEFLGLKVENHRPTLSTTGMNKWVRHPLYFATLTGLLGGVVLQPGTHYIATAFILALYLYIGSISEEKKLIKSFGNEYVRYKKQVPMLVPFTKIKRQSDDEKTS